MSTAPWVGEGAAVAGLAGADGKARAPMGVWCGGELERSAGAGPVDGGSATVGEMAGTSRGEVAAAAVGEEAAAGPGGEALVPPICPPSAARAGEAAAGRRGVALCPSAGRAGEAMA